jgi:hypothetical protein
MVGDIGEGTGEGTAPLQKMATLHGFMVPSIDETLSLVQI